MQTVTQNSIDFLQEFEKPKMKKDKKIPIPFENRFIDFSIFNYFTSCKTVHDAKYLVNVFLTVKYAKIDTKSKKFAEKHKSFAYITPEYDFLEGIDRHYKNKVRLVLESVNLKLKYFRIDRKIINKIKSKEILYLYLLVCSTKKMWLDRKTIETIIKKEYKNDFARFLKSFGTQTGIKAEYKNNIVIFRTE